MSEIENPNEKDLVYDSQNKEGQSDAEFQEVFQSKEASYKEQEMKELVESFIYELDLLIETLNELTSDNWLEADAFFKSLSEKYPDNLLVPYMLESKFYRGNGVTDSKRIVLKKIREYILSSSINAEQAVVDLNQLILATQNKTHAITTQIQQRKIGEHRLERINSENTVLSKIRKFLNKE